MANPEIRDPVGDEMELKSLAFRNVLPRESGAGGSPHFLRGIGECHTKSKKGQKNIKIEKKTKTPEKARKMSKIEKRSKRRAEQTRKKQRKDDKSRPNLTQSENIRAQTRRHQK